MGGVERRNSASELEHIQSPLCTFNEKHKQFLATYNCFQPDHADNLKLATFYHKDCFQLFGTVLNSMKCVHFVHIVNFRKFVEKSVTFREHNMINYSIAPIDSIQSPIQLSSRLQMFRQLFTSRQVIGSFRRSSVLFFN